MLAVVTNSLISQRLDAVRRGLHGVSELHPNSGTQVQVVVRDFGCFCPMPVPSGNYASVLCHATLEVSMETLEDLIGCFRRPGLDLAHMTSTHISLVSMWRHNFKAARKA